MPTNTHASDTRLDLAGVRVYSTLPSFVDRRVQNLNAWRRPHLGQNASTRSARCHEHSARPRRALRLQLNKLEYSKPSTRESGLRYCRCGYECTGQSRTEMDLPRGASLPRNVALVKRIAPEPVLWIAPPSPRAGT